MLQTLHSLKEIVNACRTYPELVTSLDTPSITDSPGQTLYSLLEKIIETIDISATTSHKRFVVKQGHNGWLDECKQY